VGTYNGAIAYSPGSRPFLVWPEFGWQHLFFFTGSEDGNILIFHRDSERPIHTIFSGHDKLVNQIALHPTKEILISVGDDCRVKMWVPRTRTYVVLTDEEIGSDDNCSE